MPRQRPRQGQADRQDEQLHGELSSGPGVTGGARRELGKRYPAAAAAAVYITTQVAWAGNISDESRRETVMEHGQNSSTISRRGMVVVVMMMKDGNHGSSSSLLGVKPGNKQIKTNGGDGDEANH
ncbi:hypothetical protein INR49_010169 [Caranx melampygus]|nr:hypothetical protein INR49_010169 [Caranx melampygus]